MKIKLNIDAEIQIDERSVQEAMSKALMKWIANGIGKDLSKNSDILHLTGYHEGFPSFLTHELTKLIKFNIGGIDNE